MNEDSIKEMGDTEIQSIIDSLNFHYAGRPSGRPALIPSDFNPLEATFRSLSNSYQPTQMCENVKM